MNFQSFILFPPTTLLKEAHESWPKKEFRLFFFVISFSSLRLLQTFLISLATQTAYSTKARKDEQCRKTSRGGIFGSFPGPDLWSTRFRPLLRCSDWLTRRTSDGETQFGKLTSLQTFVVLKFRRVKATSVLGSPPPSVNALFRAKMEWKVSTCVRTCVTYCSVN